MLTTYYKRGSNGVVTSYGARTVENELWSSSGVAMGVLGGVYTPKNMLVFSFLARIETKLTMTEERLGY